MEELDLELKRLLAARKTWLNAKVKAKERVFIGYWRYKFDENPALLTEGLGKEAAADIEKYLKKQKGCMVKKYVFVTINPRDGDLDEFIKKIKKATRKKWVDQYMWCLETRGHIDGFKWKGVHCHMKIWLNENKNYGECRRELYNTFKKLVDDYKHVDVKYSNTEGCFEDYIKGIKDKKKKKNWMEDEEFREFNKIEPFYTG